MDSQRPIRQILTQQHKARTGTDAVQQTLQAVMMSPSEVLKLRYALRAEVSAKLREAFERESATDSDRIVTLSWVATELLKEIWPNVVMNPISLRDASDQLLPVGTLSSTGAAHQFNLVALQEILLYALYYGSGVAGRVLVLLIERGVFATKANGGNLPFDGIDIAYLQLKNHQEFYRHQNKEVSLAQFLPVYSRFPQVLSSKDGEKKRLVWCDLNETLHYINTLLPVDQYHLGKLSNFIADPGFLDDNNTSDPYHLLSIIRAENVMYMQQLVVTVFEMEAAQQSKKNTQNTLWTKMFRRNSAPEVMQSVSAISSPASLASPFSNLFGTYGNHLILAMMSDFFHFGKTRVFLFLNESRFPVTIRSLIDLLNSFHQKIAESLDESDVSLYYAQYVRSDVNISLLSIYDQVVKLASIDKKISITDALMSRLFANYDAAWMVTYLTWMEPLNAEETRLKRFSLLIDSLQKQTIPDNDKECIHGRLIDLLKVMAAMEGHQTALQNLCVPPSFHPILRRQSSDPEGMFYEQLLSYLLPHIYGKLPTNWRVEVLILLEGMTDPRQNPEIAYFLGKKDTPSAHQIADSRSVMYQPAMEPENTDNNLDTKPPG